jgi:cytoskeletal protein CcmA (bactofilin family)
LNRARLPSAVEGPIHGGEVVLKSQAHVVGDIHHQSLAIESGAYFDGRSAQIQGMDKHLKNLKGNR